MDRFEFITSDEYINASCELEIRSGISIRKMRANVGVKWIKQKNELIDTLQSRLTECERERDVYKELHEAAADYILESPCDPDYNRYQWQAWRKYQELLDQFKQSLKSENNGNEAKIN